MWLCALLALAAPSKSVNLELLIPVAIPTDQLTSDEVTNSQYNRASVRDDTQESGEFSSIPSYAFSYDHKLNSHAASPVETSRSFYLTNIWPRADKDAWEDNEEGLPSPATAGQVACRELAHRQKGRAKELMLYLCEELLDVLRGSCDCCRQQEHRKKYQRVAPWFRSPALRGSPQLRTKNIVNV